MPENPDNPPTLGLFGHLMEPVVSLLIRSGITHRAFSKMCKQVFVDVAARDYGMQGRKTNDTRIAMLTGIDRREVKRLKLRDEGEAEMAPDLHNQNRVTRLLSGWHQDADFLDADGIPLRLESKGDHPSFESLASRYGGDVTVSALLSEMTRGEVIQKNADESLTVLKRYYIPSRQDMAGLSRASSVIKGFGDLLVHNLHIADPDSGVPFNFERTAINTRMDTSAIPEFHAFLDREGQVFLEAIDQWLTDHESTSIDESSHITLGAGAYFINQAPDQVLSDSQTNSESSSGAQTENIHRDQ